jgi:hypothetical protein
VAEAAVHLDDHVELAVHGVVHARRAHASGLLATADREGVGPLDIPDIAHLGSAVRPSATSSSA